MEERTKNWLSFAAGVAAGASLPVVVPAVAEAGRPLVKALIKHGLLGFERLRTGVAHATETLDDLVAEARAEAAGELTAQTQSAARSEPSATTPAATAESPAGLADAKVLS